MKGRKVNSAMRDNTLQLENKTVLITGAEGFIGSNLVLELLKSNLIVHIIGIDNMNDYYDVSIKEWRLAEIENVQKNTQNHHGRSLKVPLRIKH